IMPSADQAAASYRRAGQHVAARAHFGDGWPSLIGSGYVGQPLTDRQRNGREYGIRIIISLGFQQPFCVSTEAFCCTVSASRREKICIPARKRNCVKCPSCGFHPLAMPLLLKLIRSIGERGKDLDEHMWAPKAKRGRLDRNTRSSASEFV